MTKRQSTPSIPDDFAPRNPLIGDLTADTLNAVAAIETWKSWHPQDPDAGEPSDEAAQDLALARALLRDLVRDALRYEARRSSVK